MRIMNSRLGLPLILSLSATLGACGGDGSSSPTPTPATPNRAPSITSPANVSIGENQTAVMTVTATDPDGNALTFSVSGGEDSGLFAIDSGGQLRFQAPRDFEVPRDSNRDNVYVVQVSANDGMTSASQTVQVTVTNDREGIAVRRVATGFSQPIQIVPIPGDNRMFVIEKTGAVYRLDPSTGAHSLYRTITNISTDGERGLLGIAPAPDFAANRTIYIYVTNAQGDIELRRYRESDAELPQSPAPLIQIEHSQNSNHNGGWLGFGPDGLLYIATGDGGGGGDPQGNGQNVNSLLGKILRVGINPDPFAGATPQYLTIPAGNPFANGGGAREVFAYGLRNPFRNAFYQNALIIGDVGQGQREEIDYLPITTGAGTNFGWNFKEGTLIYQGNPPAGLTDPVSEYPHGNGEREGNSIIGGEVYGGTIAALSGRYIFADFVSGNIWSVPVANLQNGFVAAADYERRNDDFAPDAGSIDQIVSFGKDNAGNVYIVDLDGDIFVIEPA